LYPNGTLTQRLFLFRARNVSRQQLRQWRVFSISTLLFCAGPGQPLFARAVVQTGTGEQKAVSLEWPQAGVNNGCTYNQQGTITDDCGLFAVFNK
jgi:hypothetical protein